MKKRISLILATIMTICCFGGHCVASAEEAAAAASGQENLPSIHISAATVTDYFKTGAAIDNGDGNITSGGSKFKKPGFNTTTTGHGSVVGLYNISEPNAKVTSGRLVDTYVYDAATAPTDLTPWEGFKVRADEKDAIGNIRPSYGAVGLTNPGITISTTAGLYQKPIRVDSLRFMLPEYSTATDSCLLLFGGGNSTDFSLQELNKHNTLRILNGGAYAVDLSSGSTGYKAFISAGTLDPNEWYRAERILDMRIDSVADADGNYTGAVENWQRYIIYIDGTNEIVGDSGWIFTSEISKNSSKYDYQKQYPYTMVGHAPVNFPSGSYVYLDDFKTWGIDAPEMNLGESWNSISYLTYPIENDGTTQSSIDAGEPSSYRASWGLGFSTHMSYYYPGTKTNLGLNGDHSAEKQAFQKKVVNAKYLYMQQDIMIPEANTRELGFFDITQNMNYNTCYDDLTYDSKPNVSEYDGIGGVVRVKDGILTVVSDYDSAQQGYTGRAKTEDKSADFSLNLELGKWYNIQLKVDQSAYAPMTNSGNYPNLDASTTPTTAQVTVTDSEGNVYKTAPFNYKSPRQYIMYSIYQAVVLADIRRPIVSTGPVDGAKVNIDNIKCVLSDGAMDASDAIVFYEEDFTGRTDGAAYNSFITDKFNPQTESYKYGPSAYSMDLAAVVVDENTVDAIPGAIEMTLGQDISSDPAVLAENVRLYKGATDVSDLIDELSYDSSKNLLTMGITTLETNTDYTISIDRKVTEIPGQIFAVIPGADGKAMNFTFRVYHKGNTGFVYSPEFVSGGKNLEVSGISRGTAIAAGDNSLLTNNGDVPVSYVAVAVTYTDSETMEDMLVQRGVIAPEETIALDFGGETIIPDRATKMSAFVWNSWRLMDLLAPVYSYPRN